MSPTKIDSSGEAAYREAFHRLVANAPVRLPVGSLVTQNNVAREAGCDPSALRKSRYPALIREIQDWLEAHKSPRSTEPWDGSKSGANRLDLKQQIAKLTAQRDTLASQLVHADAKILELTRTIEELKATSAHHGVLPFYKE